VIAVINKVIAIELAKQSAHPPNFRSHLRILTIFINIYTV